jgi:hypothetical protein
MLKRGFDRASALFRRRGALLSAAGRRVQDGQGGQGLGSRKLPRTERLP